MIIIIFLFIGNLICFNLYAEENTQNNGAPKRAIIIGASVGMGKALAKQLAADGYIVGMTARRIALLEQIQQEIPTQTYITYMDASQPDQAIDILNAMIEEMGGLDLLVLAITGFHDCDFEHQDWKHALPVLAVDVIGFFALARTGFNFFENQGHGHLVGFSSIAGVCGLIKTSDPVYAGAKAFCTCYLDAERNKYIQKKMPIFVTVLIPGWIDSKGDFDYEAKPNGYWVETLEDSMHDIIEAINNKIETAYITKRWQKVAELLAIMPYDTQKKERLS